MNAAELKVLFFCESKNQVEIFSKVAQELTDRARVSFFYTCWDGDIASWVQPSLAQLPKEYETFNSLERTADFLLSAAIEGGKSLRPALVASFDTLFKDLDPKRTVVILGNDASRRGKALTHVLRNRGIKFALIQDGFLNFVSKSNRIEQSDQNYYWGRSQPDLAFVWGDALKEALILRHGLPPQTITVAGPLKNRPVFPDAQKSSASPAKSILWVDQAIADQRKARKDLWLREFEAIAIKLAQHDTQLRLHPSIREDTANALASIASPYAEMASHEVELTHEYLRQFDFVLCYYSTVFLDALAAKVPCIVYRTKSLDIELPSIQHPLLHYCNSLEDVTDVIGGQARNEGTLPLKHFVRELPRAAHEYADDIVNLMITLSQDEPQELHTLIPKMMGTRILEGSRICVLAGTLGNKVGAGIPISFFMAYLADKKCSLNSALIADCSFRHLRSVIAGSDVVIINSMEFFKNIDPAVCEEMVQYCTERHIQILFYLHETEFVFQALLDSHEERIRYALCNVLPNHQVLCVSEAQACWLNKLGIRDTRVVYNASFAQFSLSQQGHSFDPKQCDNVVMIGTQQPRKGVSLFSNVADLCHDRAPQNCCSFSWYGAPVPIGQREYRSAHVRFHPHTPSKEVERLIRESGLYFLSSIDDPFPLSAIEAVASGVPVVAYRNTGMAEVIDTFGNGEVFEQYTPEAACEAVLKVRNNYAGYADAVQAARENFKPEHFVAAMLSVVQNALVKKRAACEASPVVRSKADNTSPPPAAKVQWSGFDEIHTILNAAEKRIDIARTALREQRFAYAFRVSASALRRTPSSSLHYTVLEKAVAHLDEPYKTRFAELTALHKHHKSKAASA